MRCYMFAFIKGLFAFEKTGKGRNKMTIAKPHNSAFVLDSKKIDSFLNQKPSKNSDRIVKDRADSLRKILTDETRKK